MKQYNIFSDTATDVQERPRKKKSPRNDDGIVNVSSVPQRSPFRYPGGKTWMTPTVRQWLKQDDSPAALLIEPFAGGGIVSLTAAFEELADKVLMCELDPEIAAVWECIAGEDNQWLADRILNFDLTLDNAKGCINMPEKTIRDVAFSTILKNRIYHGGIIAKGSAPLKKGENGRGIASRWYPQTLYNRITAIQEIQDKLTFRQDDAFNLLEEYRNRTDCYFFIDPPYTIAGKRLYSYYELDHAKLFEYTSLLKGRFMLTYDDTEEVRGLAEKYNLPYKTIPMKTTHHLKKQEIIVTDNLDW